MKDPKRTPEEEIKFLRGQLRISVNLANGKDGVTLITATENLPTRHALNIERLVAMPEWKSFEFWFLTNVAMLYEQSAGAGRDEAYIMTRIAHAFQDMLVDARRVRGTEEQKEKHDAYDQEQNEPGIEGSGTGANLPMGDVDAGAYDV